MLEGSGALLLVQWAVHQQALAGANNLQSSPFEEQPRVRASAQGITSVPEAGFGSVSPGADPRPLHRLLR